MNADMVQAGSPLRGMARRLPETGLCRKKSSFTKLRPLSLAGEPQTANCFPQGTGTRVSIPPATQLTERASSFFPRRI